MVWAISSFHSTNRDIDAIFQFMAYDLVTEFESYTEAIGLKISLVVVLVFPSSTLETNIRMRYRCEHLTFLSARQAT